MSDITKNTSFDVEVESNTVEGYMYWFGNGVATEECLPVTYVDGMTWEEWVNSKYNIPIYKDGTKYTFSVFNFGGVPSVKVIINDGDGPSVYIATAKNTGGSYKSMTAQSKIDWSIISMTPPFSQDSVIYVYGYPY